MNDIKSYQFLLRIINIYQKVKQLSWNISQVGKRYPEPEVLTKKEIEELTKLYLALGFDLETYTQEWKELYREYKNEVK